MLLLDPARHAADLADRIERQMNDYALHGEGSVFDLDPDEQQLVIEALRALAAGQREVKR